MITFDGFIILSPFGSFSSYTTFGLTANEAWSKMIGPERSNSIDRPIYIQRLFDKGYRLKKAELTIDTSDDQTT